MRGKRQGVSKILNARQQFFPIFQPRFHKFYTAHR